ncbi:hypothetical protein ACQUWN_22935 [Rossellomorea aquimaris]|nr:hypothetical protein [Rossellomorea vietnamensis]
MAYNFMIKNQQRQRLPFKKHKKANRFYETGTCTLVVELNQMLWD